MEQFGTDSEMIDANTLAVKECWYFILVLGLVAVLAVFARVGRRYQR